MLTDIQIWDLANRMDIPMVFCDFKDRLKGKKLQHNKFYIINMENEFDEDGRPNEGSHYCAFQINKYPTGKIEGVYFDPFGQPPPQIVQKFSGLGHLPYNTKDIQSLMNSACGWYCLAWGHYINSYQGRTKHLYTDCEDFTDMFEDLSKSCEHHKNEFILKHFFRSNDKEVRDKNPIEVFKKGDFKPVEGGRSVRPLEQVADPNTIDGEDDDRKRHL
jgi:hypothetical protein